MKISLEDLLILHGCKIIHPRKIETVRFNGVSIDSRSCKQGDLFFAIKGERFDGHDFLEGVNKRGVNAAVVSKKWFKKSRRNVNKITDKLAFILVDDTIRSLGELAGNYRDKFVIPVLAVSGSNGKTTNKDLIAHVLSKKYKVLKTEKNFNNNIGVPLTLFKLNREYELCVIETGTNHFGEVAELCGIANPQFGVITNIGREHLEFFANLKGVTKAEFELVDYLENNYGMFFWNKDDEILKKSSRLEKMKRFSYGQDKESNVIGKLKKFNIFYPEIEIKFRNSIIRTKLNMIGLQSFNAALCAAAIGFYFEISASRISDALSEFNPCSGGRNALKKIEGSWIIDDTYNSNPDSVLLALENLKHYRTKGKKHIVLADMLELGKSSIKEHKNIGRLVKQMGFDNLYTYGNESYNTYMGAKGLKNNFYFSDKNTLIEFLKLNLNPDDIVLVKGSRGMKMEEVINALYKEAQYT
jgi:UDP-N-acetylmuramoyl-tripeptide--D-alanyl-D-alanine ligase